MKIIKNLNAYQLLFFITISIYCLLLAPFGFENWDSGFLPSFSWRVLNGEKIYEDFYYIRPPVSAFFHSFYIRFLPEEGQYFYTRIIFYLFFALQTFFAVSGFDNLFDLKKIGVQKWAIMTIGFVLSIHNFMPYPWFTTDGILFASTAFYLFSIFKKQHFLELFIVAFFCLLSALTKQSFYSIPIIFFIWLLVQSEFKKGLYFLISILILIFLYRIWINSFTTMAVYSSQVSQNTKLDSLIYTGFEIYIRCFHNIYILILVAIIPAIISFYKTGKKAFILTLYLKWLSITLFISGLFLLFFIDFKQITVIFFNATAVAFIYKSNFSLKKIKEYFPIAVLLCIAWCSGLSLGYSYPVLFTTGLILGFFFLMHEDFSNWNFTKAYPFIAIISCVFAFSMNKKPYREKSIFELDKSLESVSPKLKYIYTSQENLEKYLDLKNLIEKYGTNYITAPSIPQSHYIFNHKNPISADWLTNFEINNKTEDFLKLIAAKSNYIFLEKSFLENEEFIENDKNRKDFSQLSWQIYKNLKPIFETKNFLVYKSSDLSEQTFSKINRQN